MGVLLIIFFLFFSIFNTELVIHSQSMKERSLKRGIIIRAFGFCLQVLPLSVITRHED